MHIFKRNTYIRNSHKCTDMYICIYTHIQNWCTCMDNYKTI